VLLQDQTSIITLQIPVLTGGKLCKHKILELERVMEGNKNTKMEKLKTYATITACETGTMTRVNTDFREETSLKLVMV
jgi:hypothetical protein